MVYITLGLLVILLVIGEIKGILNKQFLPKILTIIITVGIGLLFSIFILDIKSINMIKYPLDKDLRTYHPYIQQFDAFQKRQLHLDVEPDERLLELENPYDPEARKGIFYLWDRAFYNGKYYSYFGIGPIITVYYPFYLLTHQLPSDNLVMSIFLILTCIFFPLSVFEFTKLFTKKFPVIFNIIGSISATLATNVFLIARGYQQFYYMASISGMAFMSMFLFFLQKAIYSNKGKLIYLFLSGLAYSLVFLSRLNMALILSIIIIPILIFYIIKNIKEETAIFILFTELFFLAFPVLITLGFTFWYNHARFGSPIDFGTKYQLTVSDISKNQLRLRDFTYAIHHYFLQKPNHSTSYPYLTFSYYRFTDYGHFVYIDANFGLFTIPLTLSLFLSPIIIFLTKEPLYRKVIILCSLMGLILIAWINFCMGGVIFRYTADLTIIASFFSLIIIILLYDMVKLHLPKIANYLVILLIVIFLIHSCITSIKLTLFENGNLVPINPKALDIIKSIFPFKQ